MPRQNQPWEVLRTSNMAYGWNTGTSITDMHCDLRVGDFISDHALVSFKVEGAKKPPATVHPAQRRAWSRKMKIANFAVQCFRDVNL